MRADRWPQILHARSQFPLQADYFMMRVQVKTPQLVYGDMAGNSCLLSPQFAWLLSSRLPAKQVPCIFANPYAALTTPAAAFTTHKQFFQL